MLTIAGDDVRDPERVEHWYDVACAVIGLAIDDARLGACNRLLPLTDG
jgi:hypothetical protein